MEDTSMKTIVPVLEGYSVDGGPIFGNIDEVDLNEFTVEYFPCGTDTDGNQVWSPRLKPKRSADRTSRE